MPCVICGEFKNIEMHQIKHIRKTQYFSMNNDETWTKVMALRKIPVCKDCHNTIYTGDYKGERLIS